VHSRARRLDDRVVMHSPEQVLGDAERYKAEVLHSAEKASRRPDRRCSGVNSWSNAEADPAMAFAGDEETWSGSGPRCTSGDHATGDLGPW